MAKRDKVRQGKVIRSWTDGEEKFLFRSRNQKLPYKEIAYRLEKSELACRLHYHHMTIGRKGHRVTDMDDDLSDEEEHSPSTSLAAVERRPPQEHSIMPLPGGGSPDDRTLPNFQTFLRDTFHQRCGSVPDAGRHLADGNPSTERYNPDVISSASTHSARTLSGTYMREKSDAAAPQGVHRATREFNTPTPSISISRHVGSPSTSSHHHHSNADSFAVRDAHRRQRSERPW